MPVGLTPGMPIPGITMVVRSIIIAVVIVHPSMKRPAKIGHSTKFPVPKIRLSRCNVSALNDPTHVAIELVLRRDSNTADLGE
jgi:hypothetical protein